MQTNLIVLIPESLRCLEGIGLGNWGRQTTWTVSFSHYFRFPKWGQRDFGVGGRHEGELPCQDQHESQRQLRGVCQSLTSVARHLLYMWTGRTGAAYLIMLSKTCFHWRVRAPQKYYWGDCRWQILRHMKPLNTGRNQTSVNLIVSLKSMGQKGVLGGFIFLLGQWDILCSRCWDLECRRIDIFGCELSL